MSAVTEVTRAGRTLKVSGVYHDPRARKAHQWCVNVTDRDIVTVYGFCKQVDAEAFHEATTTGGKAA